MLTGGGWRRLSGTSCCIICHLNLKLGWQPGSPHSFSSFCYPQCSFIGVYGLAWPFSFLPFFFGGAVCWRFKFLSSCLRRKCSDPRSHLPSPQAYSRLGYSFPQYSPRICSVMFPLVTCSLSHVMTLTAPCKKALCTVWQLRVLVHWAFIA